MSARATRCGRLAISRLQPRESPPARGAEVPLEIRKRSIEQLTARDDHDVHSGRRHVQVPENFPNQSFSPIPSNRVPELPGRHDPESSWRRRAWSEQDREITRRDAVSRVEDPLELRPPSHALRLAERVRRHGAISRQDDETESRFRPLARRRFSTSRPFFVAIRVRNPCVFLRRRRLGWKVRFMFDGPLIRTKMLGETLIITAGSHWCQRARCCAKVPFPRRPVGSPPEVFHNCGKKCGKATVFAAQWALDAEMKPVAARRKRESA